MAAKMAAKDPSSLPPLLRLPRELRLEIFKFVAVTHPSSLRSLFLTPSLYDEAAMILYSHWIPKIDIFGDEHELQLSLYPTARPSSVPMYRGRENSTSSQGRLPSIFRIFQKPSTPPPQRQKVIPQPSPSRVAETIAWIHAMPELARRHIKRVCVISMHFRLERAHLSLNAMLRENQAAFSQASEQVLQYDYERRSEISEFLKSQMPALEGFEYHHEVGPRWNNAEMKELQHVLAMQNPSCRKLVLEGFRGMIGYDDGSPEMSCLRRILRAWIQRHGVSHAHDRIQIATVGTPEKEVECWIDELVWKTYIDPEMNTYRAWGDFEEFLECLKSVGFEKIRTKVVLEDGGLEEVEWKKIGKDAPKLSYLRRDGHRIISYLPNIPR